LDYLEVLKKDTELRVTRNVQLMHSKARWSLPKKTFTKTFNSSGVMHMQRTDYQKTKKTTRKMP
jgi:hypothetical protein